LATAVAKFGEDVLDFWRQKLAKTPKKLSKVIFDIFIGFSVKFYTPQSPSRFRQNWPVASFLAIEFTMGSEKRPAAAGGPVLKFWR
jgi:hypothetical protein